MTDDDFDFGEDEFSGSEKVVLCILYVLLFIPALILSPFIFIASQFKGRQ